MKYEYSKADLKQIEINKKITLSLSPEIKQIKLLKFLKHYESKFTELEKSDTWQFITSHLMKIGFNYSEILNAYLIYNENR